MDEDGYGTVYAIGTLCLLVGCLIGYYLRGILSSRRRRTHKH